MQALIIFDRTGKTCRCYFATRPTNASSNNKNIMYSLIQTDYIIQFGNKLNTIQSVCPKIKVDHIVSLEGSYNTKWSCNN
jgi:hypothetical protein